MKYHAVILGNNARVGECKRKDLSILGCVVMRHTVKPETLQVSLPPTEEVAIDACRQGIPADHSYQCWILPESHQCVLLPGGCREPHRVHSRGHQHTVGGQSNFPIQARWAEGPQSNACIPLHGHAQHLVRPTSACPLFASSVMQSSSWDCSP